MAHSFGIMCVHTTWSAQRPLRLRLDANVQVRININQARQTFYGVTLRTGLRVQASKLGILLTPRSIHSTPASSLDVVQESHDEPGPTEETDDPIPPWLWPPASVKDEELANLADLAVDIYYINIGTGYGIIYYLVQHPSPQVRAANPTALPYILRAGLIDGGKRGCYRHQRLSLSGRQSKYVFYKGPNQDRDFPPFNSIVCIKPISCGVGFKTE
jgi:hypothetical protein